MQFNTGNPSLVSYTELLAGQPSNITGSLYPEQEVKDAVNQAYQELWDKAVDSDPGWGRKESFVTSVADQILYALPSDFGGRIIDVAIDLEGKDLSSDSTATWNYLTQSEHEDALKEYRLGNISSTSEFYAEIRAGSSKFGIVSPPGTGGSNSISIIYEVEYTPLSADVDEPIIPQAFHKLICYLAAISLRVQKDFDVRNLQLESQRLYTSFLERVNALTPDHDASFSRAGVTNERHSIKTGFHRRK